MFFGKGQCGECHPAPYYTDNTMHNLQAERFFKPQMVNGRMAASDGPIKTFPLRGIKESPPYMHDGRLLTLEDTVEFFNQVLETKLTEQEKQDLTAFMRCPVSLRSPLSLPGEGPGQSLPSPFWERGRG